MFFFNFSVLNKINFSLLGMAFLYMHLSETLFKDNDDQRQKYLKNALRILEHDQRGLRGRRMTFVCGDPGDYMS